MIRNPHAYRRAVLRETYGIVRTAHCPHCAAVAGSDYVRVFDDTKWFTAQPDEPHDQWVCHRCRKDEEQ
jgi:hypothetical protein